MNQDDQKKFNINPESGAINIPHQNSGIDTQDANQTKTIFEENGTFCRVGTAARGLLEVDIQSIKQNRYPCPQH